jgi:serine/threonine protein kinase
LVADASFLHLTPDATSPVCPRCGAPLPVDRPEGLCPACLLARANEPLSAGSSGPSGPAEPRLAAGQRFGPYRIDRLLGRGGMGEVYEAVHLDQNRRVALKILGQRLADPADRARFLHEGQLAASISDPHVVYVYDSDEIDGVPVIAMELLPGGTLKDRVLRDGPLRIADATAAIRQVLAGLEAARAAGILHRDVKPSNCFVGADGTVKIGDFGLSISTLGRDAGAATGRTFHGTPQFAAPEQRRGEAIDARADIYAVGATLYYLLTGRPPTDIPAWHAGTNETGARPSVDFAGIPRPLAAVIRRSMTDDPAMRFPSYEAFDRALRKFDAPSCVPAPLNRRFVAGAMDSLLLGLLLTPTWLHDAMTTLRTGEVSDSLREHTWIRLCLGIVLRFAYYTALEGHSNASLGKRVLGLRVLGRDYRTIGVGRAAVRTLVYDLPAWIGYAPLLVLQVSRPDWQLDHKALSALLGMLPLLAWGMEFSTARRRNGFAGLHDLAADARVVRAAPDAAVTTNALHPDPMSHTAASTETVGPFSIARSLGRTETGELLSAFDPTLRRWIWIHRLPSDAPAVPIRLRDTGRSAPVHWLAGERGAAAWDAYEAVDGEPLRRHLSTGQPWSLVRVWLLDLTRDFDAGLRDDSWFAFSLDHVWISRQHQLRILPFAVGSTAPEPAGAPMGFDRLRALVLEILGLAGARNPLPLPAQEIQHDLSAGVLTDAPSLVAALTGASARDRVTSGRRVASIALCGAIPALFALTGALVMPYIAPLAAPTDDLLFAMERLMAIESYPRFASPREHDALEIYIVGRWGSAMGDDAFWRRELAPPRRAPFKPAQANAALESRGRRLLAERPHVSPAELAAASSQLASFLNQMNGRRDMLTNTSRWGIFVGTGVVTLLPGPFLGTFWALVLRGGFFLRLLGIAVVTRDGRPAARWRTLWRAIVAWWLAPGLGGVAALIAGATHHYGVAIAIGISIPVVFLAGAIWAALTPERGPQDRLAGTWLVAR